MSTTKQSSKRAVRPRRMWAIGPSRQTDSVICNPIRVGSSLEYPVLVIDLSVASVRAVRDAAVDAFWKNYSGNSRVAVYAALASIGIKATKGKRALTDAAKGE